MVIHPSITVAVVTHFISSSSSILAMLSNLALLGDVLRGGTSVIMQWRNVVMASILLAAAAWEGANDKEAKEVNTDNKLANSWQ